MWFTYIRVAVAVAPAASVPLLPTPLKKSHLHLHRLDGRLLQNANANNITKKKDFEDVAGRRGVEPLC